MSSSKRALRRVLELVGYSAHRWSTNRFDGMQDALLLLWRFGYSPGVIVDAGANVGNWTRLGRSVFHDATTHLVEPQPACREVLDDPSRCTPTLTVHPGALAEQPCIPRARIAGEGETGGGAGGRVARLGEWEPGAVECPATTLNGLLAGHVVREDRALLKLDLDGHELTTLLGARRLLDVVEVRLTELQFFDINARFAEFADVVGLLRTRGFEPYDLAGPLKGPRDPRLCMGGVVFVRRHTALSADGSQR